jgi:hypothetical protein
MRLRAFSETLTGGARSRIAARQRAAPSTPPPTCELVPPAGIEPATHGLGNSHHRWHVRGSPPTVDGLPQTQPAFAHWDGTAWAVTVGPPIPGWGQMYGIGGPSSDRLWAVGGGQDGVLMERWNGTSWQVVQVSAGQWPAMLLDVVVDSGGVGWAVGTTNNGKPLVVHTCHS